MPFVDENIKINDGQKAMLSKYQFGLQQLGRDFEISDPLLSRAMKGVEGAGRYKGKDIDKLLSEAVGARQGWEASKATAGDTSDQESTQAQPEQPAGQAQTTTAPKAKGKAKAKTLDDVKADGTDKVAKQTATKAATAAKTPRGKTVKQAVDESPKEDPEDAPQEIKGATLDDTGKRVRKVKTPAGEKVKKDIRYVRANRIIVRHLDKNAFATIDADHLSGIAKGEGRMSPATAMHCINAWNSAMQILAEYGVDVSVFRKLKKPAAPKKTDGVGDDD